MVPLNSLPYSHEIALCIKSGTGVGWRDRGLFGKGSITLKYLFSIKKKKMEKIHKNRFLRERLKILKKEDGVKHIEMPEWRKNRRRVVLCYLWHFW